MVYGMTDTAVFIVKFYDRWAIRLGPGCRLLVSIIGLCTLMHVEFTLGIVALMEVVVVVGDFLEATRVIRALVRAMDVLIPCCGRRMVKWVIVDPLLGSSIPLQLG